MRTCARGQHTHPRCEESSRRNATKVKEASREAGWSLAVEALSLALAWQRLLDQRCPSGKRSFLDLILIGMLLARLAGAPTRMVMAAWMRLRNEWLLHVRSARERHGRVPGVATASQR